MILDFISAPNPGIALSSSALIKMLMIMISFFFTSFVGLIIYIWQDRKSQEKDIVTKLEKRMNGISGSLDRLQNTIVRLDTHMERENERIGVLFKKSEIVELKVNDHDNRITILENKES